jgi:hypothetical protein
MCADVSDVCLVDDGRRTACKASKTKTLGGSLAGSAAVYLPVQSFSDLLEVHLLGHDRCVVSQPGPARAIFELMLIT